MKRSTIACLLTTSLLLSGAEQKLQQPPSKTATTHVAAIQQQWQAKQLELASELVLSLTETPPNIELYPFPFVDWLVQELIKNGQHNIANQIISDWIDQEKVPDLQENELMQHFITNIDYLIATDAYRIAEKMVRQWRERDELSAKQEVSAFLAQANIAEAEKIYPLARTIFDTISRDKKYNNLPEQITAHFGIVRIDRLLGVFDLSMAKAEQILKDHEDPLIQSRAYTEIAEIHRANSDWKKAKQNVTKALALYPHNKQTKLLHARIDLAMNNAYSAQDIVMPASAGVAPVLEAIIPAAPHASQHYQWNSKDSNSETAPPPTNQSKDKEHHSVPPSFVQVNPNNKTTTFSSDVDTASY